MARTAGTPTVLLISPGIIKWTDMDFGLPHLVNIGGYLLQHFGEGKINVEILDLNYEGTDHAHLQRTLDSLGPYVCIGLSCYSSFDYMRVMCLARFVKTLYPDVPLVTGGYHASALPTDMVFDGSPFDAVLPGEAERPMARIVETLLGGGRISTGIMPHEVVEDLNDLPLHRWDLLNRYWPRAKDIGRKFQFSMSRGCPYKCTFCMERAKGGYTWRAYSAERSLDELSNLARYTDLSHWVINISDPLFGLKRSWRRQVLKGIIDRELFPRQYWTLTRSDDLQAEDVELFAKARFSIGIGLESADPRMLKIMQKGNTPEKYLAAIKRLARLSRDHGLNWATNIIIGHPGETLESMARTHEFMTELFTEAKETCGWLSIDPFRLYPGAHVHEFMDQYSASHGTRFHHPEWWKSWYDGSFRAEHLDPSSSLDFEGRTRFMYEKYPPLVNEIAKRFRGQGRSVDRVFKRSLAEQARLMSAATRDAIIQRGRVARRQSQTARDEGRMVLKTPIGLHVRDPWVRKREDAVRRLLESGAMRTEVLIEALLQVAPEDHLPKPLAEAMLSNAVPDVPEGDVGPFVGFHAFALGLEALNPGAGERVIDLTAVHGYVSAVLSAAVGSAGEVIAVHPLGRISAFRLRSRLSTHSNVKVQVGQPLSTRVTVPADAIWLGGALPQWPRRLTAALVDGGRAVTFLGPRFRPQDLVCLTRDGAGVNERSVARARAAILRGPGGWLSAG